MHDVFETYLHARREDRDDKTELSDRGVLETLLNVAAKDANPKIRINYFCFTESPAWLIILFVIALQGAHRAIPAPCGPRRRKWIANGAASP